MVSSRLTRKFYLRPTLEVAPDLIGKFLIFESDKMKLVARIVEVEAYIGDDDPACHASGGQTARNEVMFGQGGFSYIYFIYGMHHCLNVVTEEAGFPAAVLIRGAEPVTGVDLMKSRFKNSDKNKLTDGPGKICKAFGLTREHNGLDLVGSSLYLENRGYNPRKVLCAPRIGITRAVNRKWRYVEKDSPYVSAKLK